MDDKEGSAVTAVVKWFNPHKRYGFVHIPERNQDAFMHASVLAEDGDWPREDDTIECTLDEDGRGLKVSRVLKMSRAEGLPRTHGAVRWFDRRKGYGFIVTEQEQDQDIFVHRSALGQLNEEAMQPGRFVTFRARDGKKGLAAADVELDDAPPAEVADRIRARLDADAGGAAASEQPPPEAEAEAPPAPEAEASPAPEAEASPEPEAEASPAPEAEASPEPEAEASPEPEASPAPEAPASDDQPAPDEADQGDQPAPEAEATSAAEAPDSDDQPTLEAADEGEPTKEA